MRCLRMSVLRLSALFAISLLLTGCGTVGRMIGTMGRALHLHSETNRTPEDFRLESRDVRESLAAGARIGAGPSDAPAELARR